MHGIGQVDLFQLVVLIRSRSYPLGGLSPVGCILLVIVFMQIGSGINKHQVRA